MRKVTLTSNYAASLLLLLLRLQGWLPMTCAFVLHSVEHRPSMVENKSNAEQLIPNPPAILRQQRLSKQGDDPTKDTSIPMSRFLYIGCFQHGMDITTSATFGIYRDPNECIVECQAQPIYEEVPISQIVVAVHNDPEQGRCGCATKSEMKDFQEQEKDMCDYRCKDFMNPLCGGGADNWGIFMEYDGQSLSTQGAFDPWRNVFFSVVTVKEATITGTYPTEEMPERYYIHAVDTIVGVATYQFQMIIPGVLYGLQYDLDSTRLVALYTHATIGRMRQDMDWQYKLAVIPINSSDIYWPQMHMSLATIEIVKDPDEIGGAGFYMAYSGASCIFSKQSNAYVFTQVNYAAAKSKMKDRVYIVRIPDGFVIREEALDFKVTSLFSNELYGDLSALGPRMDFEVGMGVQTYVYLGRVYRSEIEQRTLVDWQYSSMNPKMLANPDVIGDWQVYPGVAASEHSGNQTAIAFRYKTEEHPWGAFTVATVGVRRPYFLETWCNDTCQGTLDYDIPYAAIYNREPGIPLLLKAPAFEIPARFNMDGTAIIVEFDKATLQGGRTIDTNGDFVPDEVDPSMQRGSEAFDCSEMWMEATVWKLGPFPNTFCEWKTSSKVRINIAYVNISVGDSLFILPNVLYAIPSNDEWSPATTGGVVVAAPSEDDLSPPVIQAGGVTTIDSCSPIQLSYDSYLDGGLSTWNWSWVPEENGQPNPEDLANRQGFEFDPIKLQTVKDILDEATASNNKTLNIAGQLLEPASRYTIQVAVTSRWNLTSTQLIPLEKLAFPSPAVEILGEKVLYKSRVESVVMTSKGTPSQCSDPNTKLAYRWLVSGQEQSKSGVPLTFVDFPDIITNQNTLTIPSFTLEPAEEGLYNTYNFTVECYVDSEFGDTPDKTASAQITVKVSKSPIRLQLSSYDRVMTISQVLVLDGTSSIDPDYPPASDGLTFDGTFEFRCLTPEPERAPCFPATRRLSKALGGATVQPTRDGFARVTMPAKRRAPIGRRLAVDEDGWTSDLGTCRLDIGTRLYDGDQMYYSPLFEGDLTYCEYARGVLMVRTVDFSPGEYKFTVRATHYDEQRTGEIDVMIMFTTQLVPRLVLSFVGAEAVTKFPVTLPIRVRGSEEGEPSDVYRTYTWQVFVYELNPLFDKTAQENAVNTGGTYNVDEFVFIDKSEEFDTTVQTKFESSPASPNIVVKAHTLKPSTYYKLRLNVNLASVTGYSDISIITAGLAPRNGGIEVIPMYGLMTDNRQMEAASWTADDTPLSYQFGYYHYQAGRDGAATLMPFEPEPRNIKRMEVSSIPLGTLDEESGNYTIPVYVRVCTPYEACSVEVIMVGSAPPEDPIGAAEDLLSEAANGDASEALNTYSSALSIAGGDPAITNLVLDGLDAQDVASASEAATAAAILATMAASPAANDPEVGERITGMAESLTVSAAESGWVTQNPAIAENLMSAMSNLLPGGGLGGRRLQAASNGVRPDSTKLIPKRGKPGRPSPRGAASAAWASDDLDLTQVGLRQKVNHPMPDKYPNRISGCHSPFCDRVGLWCLPPIRDEGRIKVYRCCNEKNREGLCDDPPCWHNRNSCPKVVSTSGNWDKALPEARRLQKELDEKRSKRRSAQAPLATSSTSAPPPRRRGKASAGNVGNEVPQEQRGESWFDAWVEYNFPYGAPGENEVSEYNRIRGYHGWHPDIRQRRLQFMSVNDTISADVRLQALEDKEKPLVHTAEQMVYDTEREKMYAVRTDAEQEVLFNEMAPSSAERLRAEERQRDEDAALYKLEADRNASQRITRIVVMRDTLCKAMITAMVPNEQPKVFLTSSFRLTMGKTPDLTNANPHFEFPAPYFKRAADSPDYPTPIRPLTGFAYIYVEYFENLYSWSESNPLSNQFAVVSLIVLKASTKELDITMVDPPIKIFQQYDLYSNALCLYWDRFAMNTAGGTWSTKGVMNDGDSCITTHLSDIAVFLDGRVPEGHNLVEAATSWEREVWEAHCIGCEAGANLFPVAVLGMILFTNMLLILLGYVQDERRRSDMKKNKVRSRYFFDGDGLTAPLSVDDPIAYSLRDNNMGAFVMGTLTNVVMREHAIVGVVFYHETFTRPQRLQCFTAMLVGLLAINAAVHSHPGHLQQAKEYMITGVLSGLLIFPIFCGLVLMFNLRPSQVKKRLIKKTYSTKEIDIINEQRQKVAHQTSLLPPKGYSMKPPQSINTPGVQTLLNMPAPLPLPPMMPGMQGRMLPGMMALPPPPPGMQQGGMAGMLALPAMPGMSANMPLPPPPKYPPPPKSAKVGSPAALMPPLSWPKVGRPPPVPFPALQIPDASVGGTYTNLPVMGSNLAITGGTGDTGATPMQLHDHAASMNLPNMIDQEVSPARASFKDDMSHGMAPPLPGSMPDLPVPEQAPGAMGPIPSHPGPPSQPGGSRRPSGSSHGMSSSIAKQMALAPLPLRNDAVPPPLFIRGQPPPNMNAPMPPLPPGPSGMIQNFPLAGQPPPGMGPPAMPGRGGQPPLPPPPPREDDQAFVRRIKLTYMDKVTREHDKHDLLEDHDELGKDVPFWVFDTMTTMPYLASCTFTFAAIFVVLQYGVKFQPWQEEYWWKGSLVGLFMIVILLELFRIVMMTLVELRKFENRRKAKAGHFMQRRVRREGDDFQAAPPPRLWKRAVAQPLVPKREGAQRPQFLPKAELPAPPTRPAIGPGPPAGAGGRIPIMPARPPVFSAASMSRAGALDEPPVPGTPPSNFNNSAGPSGTGFMTPQPGTPTRSGAPGPPGGFQLPAASMQRASDLQPQGGSTPGRAPPSPTHSLSSLAQSLNQQVKAGRHAEAPPPPAQPGAVPAQGSVPPPPAPAAPPPSYSRPPSRPTSANPVRG